MKIDLGVEASSTFEMSVVIISGVAVVGDCPNAEADATGKHAELPSGGH